MPNKIDEIINNLNDYAMGEIIRYNGKIKIKKETVAEHSFMVGLTILEVGNVLNIPESIINKAVVYGLLHDIPEQYFGDFPYEIKSNEKYKETFEQLEDDINLDLYNNKYKNRFGKQMLETMKSKKSIPYALVDLADCIAVYRYAKREVLLGNLTKEMLYIKQHSQKRVEKSYEELIILLDKVEII